MSRQAEYVSAVREANRALWNAYNALLVAQREWNALDYTGTLAALPDGLTAADLGAVVFDTVGAIGTVMAAGHATNMAKLL